MRTLKEITQDLQEAFMRHPSLKVLYGIEEGESFGDHFGKASVESLLIYIVAYCTYALEYMMEKVQAEIEDLVNRLSPGRADWYARKLREYLNGVEWDPDTGEFVLEGDLSDDELERLRIIKHAVAEDSSIGQLVLKIAGEEDGERCPIGEEEERQILAYISRIKYAGVFTKLINQQGDTFNCIIDIWYDPLLKKSTVENNVRNAIKDYLRNLPFNGEYSNMALVDAIQKVAGVDVVEMQESSYVIYGENESHHIETKVKPYAGYFNPGEITLNLNEH